MNVFTSVTNALWDLTMALTPKFFERNGYTALLGGCWAATPWALLSAWLFTTASTGLLASIALTSGGIIVALWALCVFVDSVYGLSMKYRTMFDDPVVPPVPR
jgi:hypothetical protein